jgi:hypothetical protein
MHLISSIVMAYLYALSLKFSGGKKLANTTDDLIRHFEDICKYSFTYTSSDTAQLKIRLKFIAA